MPVEMSEERFEELVLNELDALPDAAVEGLDNLIFVIEARPDDGSLDTLGVYEGVSIVDRADYGFGELPDRIVLYRDALLEAADDEAHLREEVHITLMHEIAHYYGIEHETLDELGWM